MPTLSNGRPREWELTDGSNKAPNTKSELDLNIIMYVGDGLRNLDTTEI